ncbi:hypothetical protein R3P38DRAFT_3257407 [Favolaschia claudopus]|uniref:Pentatricopeptide repeat-containing protein n=1 Tax=Favolaschia claudopus TaxID=2862362 RepID=A0AAW0DER2_9AGAR
MLLRAMRMCVLLVHVYVRFHPFSPNEYASPPPTSITISPHSSSAPPCALLCHHLTTCVPYPPPPSYSSFRIVASSLLLSQKSCFSIDEGDGLEVDSPYPLFPQRHCRLTNSYSVLRRTVLLAFQAPGSPSGNPPPALPRSTSTHLPQTQTGRMHKKRESGENTPRKTTNTVRPSIYILVYFFLPRLPLRRRPQLLYPHTNSISPTFPDPRLASALTKTSTPLLRLRKPIYMVHTALFSGKAADLAAHLADIMEPLSLISVDSQNEIPVRDLHVLAYAEYLHSDPALWRRIVDYMFSCGMSAKNVVTKYSSEYHFA